MNLKVRTAVLAALLAVGFAGCSRPAAPAKEGAPDVPKAADGTASSVAAVGDDPCDIVSKDEVRGVFAGASAGKRDHSMDQYGMASCVWELPSNKLAAQIFASTNSAEEEVRGRMLGFLDPLQPGLRDRIQYDQVPGLGDEAVAVAVKADQARGILADTAMLGIRRGERMVVLFTAQLVNGDPAASKQALSQLGASAAPRL